MLTALIAATMVGTNSLEGRLLGSVRVFFNDFQRIDDHTIVYGYRTSTADPDVVYEPTTYPISHGYDCTHWMLPAPGERDLRERYWNWVHRARWPAARDHLTPAGPTHKFMCSAFLPPAARTARRAPLPPGSRSHRRAVRALLTYSATP